MKLTLEPCDLAGVPSLPDDRSAAQAPMLDRLYRGQAARLLGFFARRTSRQDAEDLVIESFVRFAGASAVRGGCVDDPEAYLQEVAKNVLRNRARAAFHRSVCDVDIEQEAADPAEDPVRALEARDMLRRMEAALARLSPKTRAIFVAHRLDGATYADLAERHGLSVKGVEWHMSKAIALLHRAAGKR